MLRGALPGHNVQHNDASQDALLHGQSDHSVHGHLLPHHSHILPALRQWREGKRRPSIVHIDHCYHTYQFARDDVLFRCL